MLDGLEHVAAVIGFNDDRRTAPQSLRYQSGNVPEIHQGCDPGARVGSSEAKVIDCIVWHRKWMKVDIADAKVAARIDFDHPIAQGVRAPARLVVSHISM